MPMHQDGITLVELMIALAVSSILIAIGAPALGSILAHTRQQSAETTLQLSLMHARDMAIAREMQIVVCPTSDGAHCVDDDLWHRGWLIGTDADGDREPDAALARFDPMPQGLHIVSSQGRPRVVFQPDGSAGGSNAQLTICNARDVRGGSAVIVSISGRVRVAPADAQHLHACLAIAG